MLPFQGKEKISAKASALLLLHKVEDFTYHRAGIVDTTFLHATLKKFLPFVNRSFEERASQLLTMIVHVYSECYH